MSSTINVDCWIHENLSEVLYTGDSSFLAGPTERTTKVWEKCAELLKEEIKRDGCYSVDTETVSDIDAFLPSYIDKERDLIVGLQGREALQRCCKPAGGARMVKSACEAYGYKMSEEMFKVYTTDRKTHNDGVFDAYSDEMRACRSSHLLTGLPDSYGRGRIIGDYRRVALYGVDAIVKSKDADKKAIGSKMDEETIRLREELSEQIRALGALKSMASKFGYDIGSSATTAREAIQWTYFAYLAAVKQQDGAAMSFGRIDTFFDVYINRDIQKGILNESQAQELIDDFVVKLRLVRHLRTPAFEELFSGNPTWVTATVGGLSKDMKPLVTKTSFRMLNTLINLGPAPEPNMTVLWSVQLPEGFKKFCAHVSIQTSSIQYENDDIMRAHYGSDYSIACCVSGMAIGKQMQFFGARCNLPKLLLYVINEGKDELSGKQVGPRDVFTPFPKDGALNYENVMERFLKAMEWMAAVYSQTMNIIHYMHDKYNYESIEMALHDSNTHRFMAYGCAGISVMADSFSAMKYAKVFPQRDERGITIGFDIQGDFPKYGNDDDRVDSMAKFITHEFITRLRKHETYRNSEPTLSVLTITSNVVYGKGTGATPDGRKKGDPFAPGANPMHGRDSSGAIASLNSVAKIDYSDCLDGVSNTFSLVPTSLGKDDPSRIINLVSILDGYFGNEAHHLNVNVLNRETLLDAVDHPEQYPQLTVRVSGYAVHFIRLTKEQQMEVIARTFHERM
eukprot:Platyproteum_vivax@DN7520_c0_g1_i1.p1